MNNIVSNINTNGIVITRLTRGMDLKDSIRKICIKENIKAGVILSSVGSIKKINIRLPNLNTFMKEANYEIISLNGTLSSNRIHLHISVSDINGNVIGGHLLEETIIDTTCELVIQKLECEFIKEYDDSTKFDELAIKMETNNE